jgi:hypothetical protein
MSVPRLFFFLLLAPLPLAVAMAISAGCELVVNANVLLDASVSDVIDCGICADVSADASYDAYAPVDDAMSRDGAQPGDAREQ